MASDKTYAGQLKVRTTKYGEAYDVMLFPDDIKAILARQSDLKRPDSDPVRLSFMGKREPKNDWTHYGVVDTWESDRSKGQEPSQQPETGRQPEQQPEQGSDEPLPF